MGCTGFIHGTVEDRQVEGSPSTPTICHVETRLPHDKPALLLDIGSVGIWPAMNGYANKPLWPYGPDCDMNSDAESVLSQPEELDKVARSARTIVYAQSHC